MKLPEELQPYHEPLEALQNLISRYDQRGVVIGGIATSVLGQARYIEYWVKSFAEILEMPELWGQIKSLFNR